VTLSQLEHLMVALAATCMLLVIAGMAMVGVRLRRRWRRRHNILLQLVQRSLDRVGRSGLGRGLVRTVASPAWWQVQRDRQAMWRSVTAARHAVSVAARADAPVGELPALVRQLRQAAVGVDAALRASGGERRLARAVAADRIRIEAAAADIRAAAVASLGAMRADVQQVASAVSVEVAALAAGVQAARSAGW
jgi:hypothetical protein